MAREHPVRRGAVLIRRADAAAEVVDRVVPAEQDAVVARQPVVVELVGHVSDPLPARPADGGELRIRQRLGHEHIVVHGNRVQSVNT